MLYSIGLKYLPGLNFNKRLTYDNAKFERQNSVFDIFNVFEMCPF